MKLRIKGNSIRLRLTRNEVTRLETNGAVRETVGFGPGLKGMSYELVTSPSTDELKAEFADGTIRVSVPESAALRWAGSEDVAIETAQPTGDGEQLKILIEKDFECLADRAGEDESDAFPNPRSAARTSNV